MKGIKTEQSTATDKVNALGLGFCVGSAGAMDEWLRDKRERTHVSMDVP
jgi:hypothetical protein